jgi:hypothetical protein
MRTRKRLILGMLASILCAPVCWAQAPAVPAVPASPPNLWSFLLPNADQKAACKACFCKSPIGQMVSGAAAPMAMMSGGLMPNCCAQRAIEDALKKDATSSEGAAGRIKADEAAAAARREAVRYLGTVDCNYWPEAVDALSLSLRKDPSECVRFEAALALRNGCCCQEKTVKALTHCVEGSDKDGAPKERSDRVRAAAADALARCPMLAKETDKDKDKIKKTQATDVKDFYAKVTPADREQIVKSARGVLVSLNAANRGEAVGTNPGSSQIAPIHQRVGSLSGIVSNAFAVEPPSSGTRQPFFTNLTSALKGKQEYMVATRRETIVPITTPTPLPVSVVDAANKPTAPSEPMPGRESVPIQRSDLKPGVSIEIPIPAVQLGQPTPTKTAAPLEIIQPRPIAEPPESSPRQTRGVVTIEQENAPPRSLPELGTPTAPRR